jgi:hypothetical protein
MNTYDPDESEAQALFLVQLRSQGFASVTQTRSKQRKQNVVDRIICAYHPGRVREKVLRVQTLDDLRYLMRRDIRTHSTENFAYEIPCSSLRRSPLLACLRSAATATRAFMVPSHMSMHWTYSQLDSTSDAISESQ